jgi:hypothetical protein
VELIYNTCLRQIATTVNALVGALPAQLQTTYATVPLTSANFDSSIFSFGFLKDKLLNSQEALFMALASTATNPLRGFIETQTGTLAYGEEVLVDSDSLPVVGAFGTVRDAENDQVLTLNEIEDISTRNRSSWMIGEVYQYAFVGNRVYATREGVVVDVCGYVRPDSDSLDLTADILLPDVLGPSIVQGAVGECFRDDEYMEQASQARANFNQWLQALGAGMAQIEQQTNPTPDAQKAYAA